MEGELCGVCEEGEAQEQAAEVPEAAPTLGSAAVGGNVKISSLGEAFSRLHQQAMKEDGQLLTEGHMANQTLTTAMARLSTGKIEGGTIKNNPDEPTSSITGRPIRQMVSGLLPGGAG